jgi:hypothetical protein
MVYNNARKYREEIMRKMKNLETGFVIEVKKWLILKNLWEYYIIKEENGLMLALVYGNEIEMGYVSREEIEKYIIEEVNENELDDLMPCYGWQWI